jgi:hypothetical protein
MSHERTILPVKFKLLLAALGLIGTGIVILITSRWGAALDPDSIAYIAGARSISHGTGYATPYDGVIVYWPPLYPALLAAVDFVFGVDPLLSAHILNALLFGFVVYLSGQLFFRHLSSSAAIALLGTISVLVAGALVLFWLTALSELPFICFVLIYLTYFESYLAKGDMTSLVLLSSSVALACLTRYVGVILVITGVAGILSFRRDSLKNRIWHIFVFIFVSTLPIGVWLIRNYLLTGTLVGWRSPTGLFTLSQDLTFILNTFVSWYVPGGDHRLILVLLSATLGFLAGVAIRDNWSKVKVILLGIAPTLLLVIVYIGFLIIASRANPMEQSEIVRFLSPVFVPITLLILYFACEISELLAERFSRKLVNVFLMATIAAWTVYSARAAVSVVMIYTTQKGMGYSSELWRNSETIQYLLQHPNLQYECGAVYTNDSQGSYIRANLVAKVSPVKTGYNAPPETAIDISQYRGSWPEEVKACLVWFDMRDWKHLFTIHELQTVANMDVVVRLKDGAVYSVTRK